MLSDSVPGGTQSNSGTMYPVLLDSHVHWSHSAYSASQFCKSLNTNCVTAGLVHVATDYQQVSLSLHWTYSNSAGRRLHLCVMVLAGLAPFSPSLALCLLSVLSGGVFPLHTWVGSWCSHCPCSLCAHRSPEISCLPDCCHPCSVTSCRLPRLKVKRPEHCCCGSTHAGGGGCLCYLDVLTKPALVRSLIQVTSGFYSMFGFSVVQRWFTS